MTLSINLYDFNVTQEAGMTINNFIAASTLKFTFKRF